MSDYIKREDAIAAIEEIDWFHVNDRGRLIPGSTSHMESYVPYDKVESAIQTLPAADAVERKKGEWVSPFDIGIICNQCGYDLNEHGIDVRVDGEPNYCPNCGADMREVNDGT